VGSPEGVHVEARGDDRMGFLATLVVEVSSMGLQCRKQCHHLPEDLLVGLCELR
jgi:hypothetical protein